MHYIVVGLGFGDEGKGATVDRLCSNPTNKIGYVVRFNGGCQAAHNVVRDDGRHHTFSQFGSGTFAGAATFLSKYVMFEPFALRREAAHLLELGIKDPLGLVTVDSEALLTTPYHWEVNKAREIQTGHGSTGRGIGETMQFALEYPDLAPKVRDLWRINTDLSDKLLSLREWARGRVADSQLLSVKNLLDWYRQDAQGFNICAASEMPFGSTNLVFEGAQGVLLDEWFGFHPHTTWSTTTSENARAFVNEHRLGETRVIGVMRTYHTRHGAGPFPTEVQDVDSTETHNKNDGMAGAWRTGHFDALLFNYALNVASPDEVHFTHWDFVKQVKYCDTYIDEFSRRVFNLAISPKKDLQWQEQMTRLLFNAKPVYLPGTPTEEILRVTASSVAWGPRTSQYTYRHIDAGLIDSAKA